jgi:hypothetical protein
MKGIIVACVAVPAVAAAIVLGGCSKSFCVGSGCSISGDTVAQKAQTALQKTAHSHGLKTFPPVTCPDSLDTKTGATTHCTSTGNFGNGKTQTLGITAKVTSVHGQQYSLHFQTTGFEK